MCGSVREQVVVVALDRLNEDEHDDFVSEALAVFAA